jgi:Fe-S cluster assembly iron-binding protein IscA
MIIVTPSARKQLRELIAAHPTDPVVRLAVKDLDHERIAFSITLESAPQPDDEVQDCDGLTVAIEGRSAARMNGITLEYGERGGFSFLHPQHPDQDKLGIINLN